MSKIIDQGELYKGVKTTEAKNIDTWRNWLKKNHQKLQSVWLIIYKKNSKIESIDYNNAVDEALCFGWIDSKPNKRDTLSYYQYFSKRNPKSNWSQVNKNKVQKLISEKRFSESGFEMVRIAKESGTWDALNDVDNLIEPQDLRALFEQNEGAYTNWKRFPNSVKRGILEWIFNAKRPDTRKKRIATTVSLAEENIRANQFNK